MLKTLQLRLTQDSFIWSQLSSVSMLTIVKVLLGTSTFLRGDLVYAFHHPTRNPRSIHTILHYSDNDPIPHSNDIKTKNDAEKNNYPLEMASTPPRVIRHKNRKKIKRKQRLETGPCTADEIALHVSSQYVSGSGGILKQINERRKREDVIKGVLCDTEQEEYLKKLDRHPALVLNADYQVS